MYGNRLLRRALFESARGAARVDLRMKTRADHVERGAGGVTARLSSGETVSAPQLIAAEGRNSPTRAAAGIQVARWQYGHAAIISAFNHARPHENVAYEIFYPTRSEEHTSELQSLMRISYAVFCLKKNK